MELLARSVPLRRSPHHQRCAAPRNEFTVLFDSGIRTGSDVIKAIAMGAQGVLGEHGSSLLLFGNKWLPTVMALFLVIVGRPIMYGLALGGGEGVERVLRGLLADSEVTLSLSGYNIDEIWGKREAVLEKAETSCECTVTTELWCTSLLHYFRAKCMVMFLFYNPSTSASGGATTRSRLSLFPTTV
jgi:hypothetical protein